MEAVEHGVDLFVPVEHRGAVIARVGVGDEPGVLGGSQITDDVGRHSVAADVAGIGVGLLGGGQDIDRNRTSGGVYIRCVDLVRRLAPGVRDALIDEVRS